MRLLFITLTYSLLVSCSSSTEQDTNKSVSTKIPRTGISLLILGTAQDAGAPQIGCQKDCCKVRFRSTSERKKVVSLGVIDYDAQATYLFEATPDITAQCKMLKEASNSSEELPSAIFLTHAHIGHYTGLMYLGKEATNAQQVPVYAMPKMQDFLSNNGPWDQLVNTGNIELKALADEQTVQLNDQLSVTPFLVPHRDEYSETVGYVIEGEHKKALFIPDIDKWGKWKKSIIEGISKVDYAFLDATFYDAVEINNRDISQIPHPFVIESMDLFSELSAQEKSKVHFIHFNHTNPLLNAESEQAAKVKANGFNIAEFGAIFNL
ncbi:MAG: MBL fold metallo-hydrolase [Bacteroidota bacterium]